MKKENKKTVAICITFLLTLTVFATIASLPAIKAHTPAIQINTFTYVSISPNTAGIGQEVLIAFWSNEIPPTAYGPWGDRWAFYVDITNPQGASQSIGPIISDPVGGAYTMFTPTEAGTYTIVARFPQQVSTGELNNPAGRPASYFTAAGLHVFVNDTYLTSTSEPVKLTVQQDQLPKYQETPFPTDYWTRPIYGFNRDWAQISGQWLSGANNPGRINNYSEGPESSHILWSRSYWSGGIAGAEAESVTYHTGTAYESFGAPSIILEGKIYYSMVGANKPSYGWYCVDLYTGRTLYFENNTDGLSAMPTFGQVYQYESPNQHGAFPYLWRTSGINLGTGNGTVWEMLDAFTGKAITRIANVSATGTAAVDDIGDILRYSLAAGAGGTQYLRCWNLSAISTFHDASGTGVWYWRPAARAVHDGNTGWTMNVSITPTVQGTIRAVVVNNYIIGGTAGSNNGSTIVQGNLWAISLKPGQEGKILWNKTFTPPATVGQDASLTAGKVALTNVDTDNNVFVFNERLTRKWWVYSLDTMEMLWQSQPESQWEFYGMPVSIYQGKLISTGYYSGIVTTYNITTGQILWNWTAPFVGLGETPYEYTPVTMGCIADGKIYLYSTEHSITQPIRRDYKIYCLNATSGKLIWAESCCPSSAPIIADGRIVALDLTSNQIYCYGKGDSATTVSAPQTITSVGSGVMITGTVIDNTPSGRLNINGGLDFSLQGTPAISDASMDAWMEYVYHQRSIPTNATGVNVSLDTVDPNGNNVHIGDVTSDLTGAYGYVWKPEVPGTYKIIATFAGSASYGSSFAQTYMGVGEAEPTAAPTTIPQTNTATAADIMTYMAIGVIAIIIAIAIVGFLMLRKHP